MGVVSLVLILALVLGLFWWLVGDWIDTWWFLGKRNDAGVCLWYSSLFDT